MMANRLLQVAAEWRREQSSNSATRACKARSKMQGRQGKGGQGKDMQGKGEKARACKERTYGKGSKARADKTRAVRQGTGSKARTAR
jgi:hypothetical protein